MKKNKKILIVALAIILVTFGGCAALNWAFSAHTFKRGDLYYRTIKPAKPGTMYASIHVKWKDVFE